VLAGRFFLPNHVMSRVPMPTRVKHEGETSISDEGETCESDGVINVRVD